MYRNKLRWNTGVDFVLFEWIKLKMCWCFIEEPLLNAFPACWNNLQMRYPLFCVCVILALLFVVWTLTFHLISSIMWPCYSTKDGWFQFSSPPPTFPMHRFQFAWKMEESFCQDWILLHCGSHLPRSQCRNKESVHSLCVYLQAVPPLAISYHLWTVKAVCFSRESKTPSEIRFTNFVQCWDTYQFYCDSSKWKQYWHGRYLANICT